MELAASGGRVGDNPPQVRFAASGHSLVVIGLGPAWRFAAPDLSPVEALPPGKYTVTACYEHSGWIERRSAPCPYWHVTVSSGTVEIEIRPRTAEPASGPKISEERAGEIARAALRDALQAEEGEEYGEMSGKALAANGFSVEREVWHETVADKKLAGKDVWIGRVFSNPAECVGLVFVDAQDGQVLRVMIPTNAGRQRAVQTAQEWFKNNNRTWTEPVRIEWHGYDRYSMEWTVSEEEMALLGPLEMTVSASGGEPIIHPRR